MAAGRLRRRTFWGVAVLVMAVLCLHGLALDSLAKDLAGWQDQRPMPPRLSAAFVRVLQPTAPPVARPPPPTRRAPDVAPETFRAKPPDAKASAALPPDLAEAPPPPEPAEAAEAAEPAEGTAAASQPQSLAASAPAAVLAEAERAAEASALPASGTALTDGSQPPGAPASAASAAHAGSAALDFQPGPEWPASTRLDYKLRGNYRGTVTGRARVEWLREGRRYQVHLEVEIGPGFAPLIARTMSSEGELTGQGIRPQRFDEETRMLLAGRKRLTLQFLDRELVFPNGRREWAPPGVQDAASQFVQLTWLFLTGRETLRTGHEIRLPLALPRRLYAWRYVVEGEEQLDTPMGPLAAWHLRPVAENTGSDLRAEVWLAPSLQYLPVRLLIRQDEKTWIDLMLQSAPLQAAP